MKLANRKDDDKEDDAKAKIDRIESVKDLSFFLMVLLIMKKYVPKLPINVVFASNSNSNKEIFFFLMLKSS